jgi:hypothetical protein
MAGFYQPANPDTDLFYGSNSVGVGSGEVFTPTLGGSITSILVQLRRTGGTSVMSGHVRAMIYSADGGTYGTNMIGQAPALAAGDSFDITRIPNDFNYHGETLTFSGANQIALTPGTHYIFIVLLSDIATDGFPTSGIYLAAHSDGTGYPGNAAGFNSNTNSWGSASNYDIVFQIITVGGVTRSATVVINVVGNFNMSANPAMGTVPRGQTGFSNITLTSLSGFSGVISFSNQTQISIYATSTDDTSTRGFGLLIDQTLTSQFWTTQPSSVIGTGTSTFNYTRTFTLSTGSHFLEFGVNATAGHWHVQITVNGVTAVSVDTDVNHHVHDAFSVGGLSLSPVVAGGPTISLISPTTGLSLSSIRLSSGSSGTIILEISTTRTTPKGTYAITLTATSGGLSHTITGTVKIV